MRASPSASRHQNRSSPQAASSESPAGTAWAQVVATASSRGPLLLTTCAGRVRPGPRTGIPPSLSPTARKRLIVEVVGGHGHLRSENGASWKDTGEGGEARRGQLSHRQFSIRNTPSCSRSTGRLWLSCPLLCQVDGLVGRSGNSCDSLGPKPAGHRCAGRPAFSNSFSMRIGLVAADCSAVAVRGLFHPRLAILRRVADFELDYESSFASCRTTWMWPQARLRSDFQAADRLRVPPLSEGEHPERER